MRISSLAIVARRPRLRRRVRGDSATFAAFGYSEDRRYFAYEEFSIGDEGTPPYVTIKVVDLTTGALALGSPWTATSGEEGGKTISRASARGAGDGRRCARARPAPATRAHFLALIGDGVRGDRRRADLRACRRAPTPTP